MLFYLCSLKFFSLTEHIFKQLIMQNKGAIRLLAILFAIVAIYHLSFSYFTSRTEKKAVEYSKSQAIQNQAERLSKLTGKGVDYLFDSLSTEAENRYLDSMNNEIIYNLGIVNYTYSECKEKEINLGLDLKGGMNVTLEVQVEDVVTALAGSNASNPAFQKVIATSIEAQKKSQSDFITIFYETFKKQNPGVPLRTYFRTQELKDKIKPDATDEDVLKVLTDQADAAIGNTYDVLSKRIDQFGVSQPRIQRLQTAGRILVELPGVKDPKRVRKLMQSTATLEFWETYSLKDQEIGGNFGKAHELAVEYFKSGKVNTDTITTDSTNVQAANDTTTVATKDTTAAADDLMAKAKGTEAGKKDSTSLNKNDVGLYTYLMPNVDRQSGAPGSGAHLGVAMVRDTARINRIFNLPAVKSLFPRNMKLLWGFKPPKYANGSDMLELFAIKASSRDGKAPLTGDYLTDARNDYDQTGRVEVQMSMNAEGSKIWKDLTGRNVERAIAIVLDGYVYSAPNVQQEISGGNSQITGDFTIKEGEDLANVLKSGKLPVPARIIEEAIVGPSLGQEAVNAGLISFIIAFISILIYMFFFYGKAGLIADLALFANIFFLMGVLASLQAVLTLPGLAGIVLTLGMAVDANVIIYERIKEELRAGKGMRLAIDDGYKNAYSAIIDGNVTTILTGIVLYIFGSGPVQGFATTLIIGIITSLFSAIFISRLTFAWLTERNKTISFDIPATRNFMVGAKFDFIGWRKTAYIISSVIILAGIVSLFTKGLTQGIDFAGGRTYVIRFDQDVNTQDVADNLKSVLGNQNPEVKTFGPTTQVKITTKFMIEDKSKETDSIVDNKIYDGTKKFFKSEISSEEFFSTDGNKDRGKLSSQKVDPAISDDLMWESYLAIFFALIAIFAYIALRFRKWQFGLGGVVALAHDTMIVIGLFSIFSGILPFDLEVDQAFIAALLTIIGYSINDTVIVFDRIREYTTIHPKRSFYENINGAINNTLGRTINTSGTTLVVLLWIFLLGGEVIRGFIFALLVGIMVGTYSSIFVASPIAYETLKKKDPNAGGELKK